MIAIDGKTMQERLAKLIPLARRIAAEAGVPVSWLLAFARHESGYQPLAVAGIGTADERRGGSFGLIQMSLQTARSLGYTGPAPDLNQVEGSTYAGDVPRGSILDPETNLRLGAALMKQLSQRFGGNFQDIAAGYNSGKPFAKAPESTRESYVPNVVSYQQEFAALDSGGGDVTPQNSPEA